MVQRRDWTQGSITGNLWALAWPSLITSTLNVIGPTVDMIWIGRLGSDDIAAVGVAGLVVQLVMLALLAASVYSWTLIFQRRALYADARHRADKFDESFWSGGDLNSLYESVNRNAHLEGQESIFRAGFKEFSRLRQLLAGHLLQLFLLSIPEVHERPVRHLVDEPLEVLLHHFPLRSCAVHSAPHSRSCAMCSETTL